uniref:Odorant-binding protein n=1 Tax=Anopheles farauti TaxID=69004 RepID=A0A182QRD7_9DIPT
MFSIRLCVCGLVALWSTGAVAFTEHATVEKSLIQAQQECVTYLNLPRHRLYQYLVNNYANDAKTKRMVRCVGLNLGWWTTDGTLREHVIEQYFLPDSVDTDYCERTRLCVESKAPEGDELCSRAFETFQCYLQQYGQLLNCPKVVPLSYERLAETMHFCLDVLQIPLEDFKNYTSSVELFQQTEQSRCLLRCFAIRAGLYSDEHGPFADRYKLQFGPPKPDVFDNDLEGDYCATRLRREGLDECTLAARILYECYYFADTLQPALEFIVPILEHVMTETDGEPIKQDDKRCSRSMKPERSKKRSTNKIKHSP